MFAKCLTGFLADPAVNFHDGLSAYQLHPALFRFVCSNGLKGVQLCLSLYRSTARLRPQTRLGQDPYGRRTQGCIRTVVRMTH